MLPYQEDKKLEELLGRLFEDDGPTTDDVEVVKKSFGPKPSSSCCVYNYGGYS